jgi:hypothetical protein
LIFYVVLGAVFAIAGGVILRTRGWRPFIGITIAVGIIGVAGGLWQDRRNNDPDIGFTILLFLISTAIGGGVMLWLGKDDPQNGGAGVIPTVVCGMLAWILAYVVAGLIALPLNLVTF